MQLGTLGANVEYRKRQLAAQAKSKAAAATAANQALLDAQLHNTYLGTLTAYVNASQTEAQALLNVVSANAKGTQTAINQAVQAALQAENNALDAYAAMSAAAQQDNILQATLKAQATQAAYTAAKAALLPANGYWNTGNPMQYAIDQGTFNAMQSGNTIYNWWGATSVMLGRPVLCFCNSVYRNNPNCTLAQVNAYGAQLQQAAQSSDSFGSFLMGALPYIAGVALLGAAVIFTAGALAPAASGALTSGTASTALASSATTAGLAPLSASELAATTAANEAAAAGVATTAGTAGTAALTTGGGLSLTTSAGGGVLAAAGSKLESMLPSALAGQLKNALSPSSQLSTQPAPQVVTKPLFDLSQNEMIAIGGLLALLLLA